MFTDYEPKIGLKNSYKELNFIVCPMPVIQKIYLASYL